MKTKAIKNTGVLVCLFTLIVIVGISLGLARKPGAVPEPTNGQKDTGSQQVGKTNVPVATDQRGEVYHADEASFAELVLNSDVPVLLSFYADWCGPCRTLAPVLEDVAEDTKDARIVKVNVDESPQLAARYKITSIPSLRVIEDNEVVDEHVGLATEAELKKMLDT